MKKQVNVNLNFSFFFTPEDLKLDDTASRTMLMDYADVKIDEIISKIHSTTGFMPNEIDVEVCECEV